MRHGKPGSRHECTSCKAMNALGVRSQRTQPAIGAVVPGVLDRGLRGEPGERFPVQSVGFLTKASLYNFDHQFRQANREHGRMSTFAPGQRKTYARASCLL